MPQVKRTRKTWFKYQHLNKNKDQFLERIFHGLEMNLTMKCAQLTSITSGQDMAPASIAME